MKETRKKVSRIILMAVGIIVSFHYLYLLVVRVPDLGEMIDELNRGAEIDFEYVNQANEFSLALQDMDNTCRELSVGLLRNSLSNKEIEERTNKYAEQTKLSDELGKKAVELRDKRSELFSSFEYVDIYDPSQR